MLENREKYVENMTAATHAVLQNPASQRDNLLFHCNYLMKYGNLRYLKNEVIAGQTIVETYNLDVLAIMLVALLAAFLIVFVVGKKVIISGWSIFKRTKTESRHRQKVDRDRKSTAT